ncbi:ATP-grasp domain-containing protein [Paenibacillus dokdonensis]|uniref:ATP-grasp domain-containing protein n=1 Tax=Paenibacillus dokdonensis TaxID=2567944 RepID=UPI001457D405|nr:ATP-grasp domain-containing protein [Paenibacillus dokdonensis]
MESNKKAFIIISGFNPRAVIALCRVFTEYSLPFYIIALSPEDPITFSSYQLNIKWIRSDQKLNLDELLKAIGYIKESLDLDEVIVVPSSEGLNRFLLSYRQLFRNNDIIVPLVTSELYELISDKYSFGELCKSRGLAVPHEYTMNEIHRFPVVAKPRQYSNSGLALSPVIIYSNTELARFREMYRTEDFYFQEYVDGESYYLLFSFDKEGNSVSFSQKNLIQQGNGKSVVLAESSNIHLEKIGFEYNKLFTDLGYFGVVMVEIKRNSSIDYMIEANPRFWGPLQLVLDCKVPLIENWIKMCGLPIENNLRDISQSGTYLWLYGLTSSLKIKSIMYHTDESILENLPLLINNDIYLRKDSYAYFLEEMKGE